MNYGNDHETESSAGNGSSTKTAAPYKGVRRRKWGKFVSEIRVPGSQARLWLGSYATPEAAAVAHDVAFYCLRRPESLDGLNFPQVLPVSSLRHDMSPRSVQRAASDAGLAVDAHRLAPVPPFPTAGSSVGVHESWQGSADGLTISVDDYL